jgi:hypothetical protein
MYCTLHGIQFFIKFLSFFSAGAEMCPNPLNVHKNENFLAPILNFVLFHCLLCPNIKVL